MLSKTHTKYIQSLLHKKFRDELGLFIAEGPKVVMDLLESRKFVCKEIFALGDSFGYVGSGEIGYDYVEFFIHNICLGR